MERAARVRAALPLTTVGNSCDVLVVGGGITGVGCALEGTVAFVFTVTDATGQVSAAETVSPW